MEHCENLVFPIFVKNHKNVDSFLSIFEMAIPIVNLNSTIYLL